MINIFINYFTFLLIAFLNGKIFINYFCKDIKNLNNFEQSIVGLIVTGFLAQLINFFFPLNDLLVYLNLIIIFFYFFFYFKKEINLKFSLFYIPILIFCLTLASIYGSSFSDDLNHYHHGSIVNSDTGNYIIGLNSLHSHYGFASIWLTLHSYLNFDYSRLQDIHILNAIILFLFLNFIFFEIINESKKKGTIYLPILLFFLIFVLIKYTRLKEFGIDRSAFLIFFYIILFYIKHLILDDSKKQTEQFKVSVLLLLFLLCTFLFFIKIIFLFSLILPITAFLLIKKKKLILSNPLLYLLGAIYISYFTKNFLISGCLIYPIETLCFQHLPWYELEVVKNLKFNTEVFNKSFFQYSGTLTQDEYIKNFNWVASWLKRNTKELIEFIALLSLVFIITILNFKKLDDTRNNNPKIYFVTLKVIFIFSLLLIFLKTPVIRMSHHVFILFFIILFLTYFKNYTALANKKILFLLILIAFTFNISKNLIRIKSSNFINDPIYVLKKSGLYKEADKKKLDNFVYYKGWIGGYPVGSSNLDNYNYKKWFIFDIISKKKN
jgi:hypothetical protein